MINLKKTQKVHKVIDQEDPYLNNKEVVIVEEKGKFFLTVYDVVKDKIFSDKINDMNYNSYEYAFEAFKEMYDYYYNHQIVSAFLFKLKEEEERRKEYM